MATARLWGQIFVTVLVISSTFAAAGASGGQASVGSEVAVHQTAPPANDSSVPPQQRDPDTVGEEGNTEALEQWLADRLAAHLNESARQLRAGQYDAAADPLGEQYAAILDKYVEVADDSREFADVPTGERFERTATVQQEYISTRREYGTVLREYREAREAGDESRVRDRAQRLRVLNARLSRLATDLRANYRTLSGTANVSLVAAAQAVQASTTETEQQTQSIYQTVGVPTAITANASPGGSYTDPVRISGRLTADDSTLPEGPVQFTVNGEPQRTTLSGDGSFTLQYRPVNESTGSNDLRVTYVPNLSSTYLGSETTVTTTVAQETPTVVLSESERTATYTSPIRATGRVTVGEQSVPGVTVVLALDDQELARTQTNASGGYEFAVALPVNISAGTRTLAVRTGEDGTALPPATATGPVTVNETETGLALAARRSPDSITVSGRLQTGEGTGVGAQSVTIRRNGDPVATVRTDEAGFFGASIELSDTPAPGTTVRIDAEYDGEATNLNTASAAVGLTYPESNDPNPLMAAGVILALLSIAGGYGLYRYRRASVLENRPRDDAAPEPEGFEWTGGADTNHKQLRQRLDTIRDGADSGDLDEAVRKLYHVTRAELQSSAGRARTHWEFFEQTADRLSADQAAVLRELTETYEAVQFAERTPGKSDVIDLIARSEALFERREQIGHLDESDGEPTDD